MDIETTLDEATEQTCCATCMHFNVVPGMERTGVCDSNELNKRCGVPVVLTGADDVCWQWEAEKGMYR